MKTSRLTPSAILALATICAGSTFAAAPGPATGGFKIRDIWHGFGQLLPHRIAVPDANGNPTAQIVPVLEQADLIDNIRPQNGVLPPLTWPVGSLLPSGMPGNHFVAVRFNRPLVVDSILDPSPSGAATSQLTGAIQVTAVNSLTGQTIPLRGRAFVGGQTYAGTASGNPPALPLQTWFSLSGGGTLLANPAIDNNNDGVADGLDFPGTRPGTHFGGAETLADPNVFAFAIDMDGDLGTLESFPPGFEIVIEVTEDVQAQTNAFLHQRARVSSTAGPDNSSPEIRITPPPNSTPEIVPGNGATGVDPMTTVTLSFSEAVQPGSFGVLTGAGMAMPTAAVQLSYGPQGQQTNVPFTVLPANVFDLSQVTLTPAFPFPGSAPQGFPSCAIFNLVDIQVNANEVADLGTNMNLLATSSVFETGAGPGITNAPVAPDAIYVGLSGSGAALSVIDLNGFGGGSGNPTFDPLNPVTEGNTNFPNNPNVNFQGAQLDLQPGTCTTDGGSAGVFTRTLDSNLSARLAGSPVVLDVSDMVLGAGLDRTFNNAPAPFGCQAGGGNLCAIGGLKNVLVAVGGASSVRPAGPLDPILNAGVGVSNSVSWAPHPNPPPLAFPPLCVSPMIGGQEPTSVQVALAGLSNLLVPGDPFGDPALQIPPSGILAVEQNAWFQGPTSPQVQVSNCSPYMLRQQIGQFLYVVDRERRQVVVLNSNRMTPIERIDLADPARLAISPALDMLAVTNPSTGIVSFIDIDPTSATFHSVVQETVVGGGPLGIAWDSMNEDLLVCNQRTGDVAVISAFTLAVRKIVSIPQLERPFDVVITPRQGGFGSGRNVYYGYVLSRNGRVSIFESGPGGVNGWGYDDFIGIAPYVFRRPKAMQVDVTDLGSAVWVAHEGEIDLQTGLTGPVGTGAVSRLFAATSLQGQLPLIPGSMPHFRSLAMTVDVSMGPAVLTGIPMDLALDNQLNLAALPNITNPFSAGSGQAFNGKSLVRDAGGFVPASAPAYLFVAVPESSDTGGTGAVDVISLASNQRRDTNAFHAGVQSIPMPGVGILMDYFQQ